LSAGVHRCGGIVIRLPGDDCAIGIRSVRVHAGVDLGISVVRGGAAINVVACYVRTGIPRKVDAVLRGCAISCANTGE